MTKNLIERQRRLQAEQLKPAENPYQRLYGLRDNPFPFHALFVSSDPDPRKNGEIYDAELRRDEEKTFFERFVIPPTGDPPIPLGFVRLDPQAGGRGNGKSTFLHRLMVRLNTSDWMDWADPDDVRLSALAIHLLPQPKKHGSFFELIRLLFETLYTVELGAPHERRRLIRKIDGEIRATVLLDLLDEDQLSAVAERPGLTKELESRDGFSSLLTELGLTTDDVVEAARNRLEAISPTCLDNAFIAAFLNHGASIEASWVAWRNGGWVASDYRWKRSAAEWLTNGLVPVLVLAGYRRLYILLDEFEKIYVHQTGKKREEFLDLLRQVFYEQDSAAVRRQYFVTVLSIHPSIETYLKDHWARVGLHQLAPLSPGEIERISVELGKSNEPRLRHMLITYMDYFRPMDDPQRGKIYPFAKGALAPAMDKARLYPRDTLRYAHAILRKAASESIPAPIEKSYVEAFLASGQPLDEEEDDFTVLGKSRTNLTGD
ncbi:hypothetical protein [Sorangium sp. So ce426]|uniref:hypothetical protein n=1 Tax=Sorangium sp. So ce426 TaxID=3133312 RepID=UPI003F5C1190